MRRSVKCATVQPEQPEKVYIQHKFPNHEHGVRKREEKYLGTTLQCKCLYQYTPAMRPQQDENKKEKRTVAGDPAMPCESTERRTLNEEFAN
jgi:hypothetical protein